MPIEQLDRQYQDAVKQIGHLTLQRDALTAQIDELKSTVRALRLAAELVKDGAQAFTADSVSD